MAGLVRADLTVCPEGDDKPGNRRDDSWQTGHERDDLGPGHSVPPAEAAGGAGWAGPGRPALPRWAAIWAAVALVDSWAAC